MSINIGNILDLVKGTIGKVQETVNAAAPVATTLADDVSPLVDQANMLIGLGKDLFAGKKPDPAVLAKAEALRHEWDKKIAES